MECKPVILSEVTEIKEIRYEFTEILTACASSSEDQARQKSQISEGEVGKNFTPSQKDMCN